MTNLLLLVSIFFISVCTIRAQPPPYNNPVIPGDHPDPSVIRFGDLYWATMTSGTWEPEFSLFHSTDLLHWKIAGAVFQQRPKWAERDFWAPEISTDRGRFFVYYTARKKGGPLCVAVATAAAVSGPYIDHGPLVCQNIGSIDAMAVSDEGGARYLVWKEDGNSRNQPTPLWAQRLSDDGLELLGKKVELIRNDPGSWEGGVVEGVFILRRGDWFYLFYSGNGCCGRRCNYALGVARSRNLLGPYQKYSANPILAENQNWQCPGHGSIVTDKQGRDFLLYHAYRKSTSAFFIGREALLDQLSWGSDGWPRINEGRGPSGRASFATDGPLDSLFDGFEGPNVATTWQWPQFEQPSISVDADGWLRLAPTDKYAKDELGAVMSQPVTTGNFVATTFVDTSLLKQSSVAGLSVYQGRENAVGITVGAGSVSTYLREGKKHQIVSRENTINSSRIYLRMTVTDGARFRFAFSRDGKEWKNCGNEIQVAYLESARIALTAGGAKGVAAKFDWLRVTSNSAP
jgi:xylan 1,4-beta-xylosidase